jgi:integral membrane protein
MSPKSLYRLFANGEALTWALLISALIARYLNDSFGLAVTITGTIHGAMFLSYCTSSVLVGVNQRWTAGRISTSVALAIVPFATVPFERSLLRKNLLEGS